MSFGMVAMFQSELPRYLPTADELPCSDDTPVDEDWSWRKPPAKEVRNELQYYVIYNSKRRRKPKLEIHKLVNGRYELQDSNPFWMPEIGLGIGYERGDHCGLTRDWLYWYTADNIRYPTPAEQIKQVQLQVVQERSQLAQERMRSNKLVAKLRLLGIDPDEL